MRFSLLSLFACGCFIGLPPAGDEPWFDTHAALPLPECVAASIEPDDGESDDHFSPLGLLSSRPRTLCGEIDAGDVDYALFQTLEGGQVSLSLDWSGRNDLDLLVYDGNTGEWTAADGDEIEIPLDEGFHGALVADVDGDPVEYVLTAQIE